MWAPAGVFIYRIFLNKKKKFLAVNVDCQLTEFVKDKVSHAVVDKEVTAALLLVHAPSQGSSSQEEGSIWARINIIIIYIQRKTILTNQNNLTATQW